MTVRALARPSSDRSGYDQPIDWITGDLRTEQAIEQLVQGADAVVHLAYEHVPGQYRNGEGNDLPKWLDANLNGSLHLIQAAQQAGVARFIFLSSRAVFSRTEAGHVLDELHPTSPDSHYGAYKAAVEGFLSSFARVGSMATCAIRATGVYGLSHPIERSKWWDLVRGVVRDEPITSNRGGTEVHGGDVARAIGLLLARPTMNIEVLHLSDLYVTTREVVRLARQFSGHKGDLPAESGAPSNVLVSRHLNTLGLRLGGTTLLAQTIDEMVSISLMIS
jgi:nucleoside-diphosphate-sugar epimerase